MPTLYEQNRDKIKTGDILAFSGNSSFIAWAIQKRSALEDLDLPSSVSFDHNLLNHVGVALRFKDFGNRLFIMEAESRGVLPIPLSEKIEKYEGNVWHLPLIPEFDTDQYRNSIGTWALKYSGTWYGYIDIIKNIFGRTEMNERVLFCSEHGWFSILNGVLAIDSRNKTIIKACGYLKELAPVPADYPCLGITGKENRLK